VTGAAARIAVRAAGIVAVVVAATATAWLLFHALRPSLFEGEDQTLWEFLNRAFLHFDFGVSQAGRRAPVSELLRDGFPNDVAVLAGGLAFGVGAGVGGALWCGRDPRGLASRLFQAFAMAGVVAPVYVVGLMTLLIFGEDIGPLSIGIPLRYADPQEGVLDWLKSIVVPWIVVGLPLAGMCLRTMLGQMVEVEDEEFVRAARAKGVSERRILRRHIAPAALAPTAMLASSAMPVLITNVVLVEQVFSIDGVFRDLTRSIGTANVPLILGMTAVGALLIALTTLLFDLLLFWLDPRVRAGAVGR
jgi:peptide/nickel transport system permease protein